MYKGKMSSTLKMRNTKYASAFHEHTKQDNNTKKYGSPTSKKKRHQMSFLTISRTRFAIFLSTGVLLLIFLVSSSSSQGDTPPGVTSGEQGRGLRDGGAIAVLTSISNSDPIPTAVETVEYKILPDQEIKHPEPQSQSKPLKKIETQEPKICYSFPDDHASKDDGATASKRIEALSTSSDDIEITAIILTYKKHEALARLLPSLLYQQLSNFEIVIVDNGCLPETKQVIEDAFAAQDSCLEKRIPHKYVQLCDNPGYAAGNNAGAKLASATSKYILFLNDDIVLSKPDFVQRMLQLAENKNSAAAVGCKLVNSRGNELIEAGSIVFKDGSASGYGRGRKDVNAPEFSYPKPVDYVSGACLLIEKQVFMGYRSGHDFGFDGKTFPNYYEDTDLQMHIQHDLKQEVWLQPNSVARHDEHGSFGSEESENLMIKARKHFYSKWKNALQENHLKNPNAHHTQTEHEKEKAFFQAADLRARDPEKANILYLDYRAPNKSQGSGFGRAFDNLSMIAELGHRVTMATVTPPERLEWCDEACIDEITGLGVEYATGKKLGDLLKDQAGYYDVVLVSRPPTLIANIGEILDFYRAHPFALVYDCEALGYRRSEILFKLMQEDKIPFPGGPKGWEKIEPKLLDMLQREERRVELSLIAMADVVLPVSDGEANVISQLVPEANNTFAIGHVMDFDPLAIKDDFDNRNGIIFLASFHNEMYYNGDAIWYFLTEIYPLVVKADPVPLTIAGRDIPKKLRLVVKANKVIAEHVTFVESPKTVDYLLQANRIFIAPHLYGAGIQYKVSEALSVGIPVVMSTFTYDSFGHAPGCVGSSVESFKQCILEVHSDKEKWMSLQQQSLNFIQETHSRSQAMEQWTKAISVSQKIAESRKSLFEEGEKDYAENYPDVAKAMDEEKFSSAFEHYTLHGQTEGKSYKRADMLFRGLLTAKIYPEIDKDCPEGEELYFFKYPDVRNKYKGKRYKGRKEGFLHWKRFGKFEGRIYICEDSLLQI